MATLPSWSPRLPRQAQVPSLQAPHSAHHGPLGQPTRQQAVNVTGPGPSSDMYAQSSSENMMSPGSGSGSAEIKDQPSANQKTFKVKQ